MKNKTFSIIAVMLASAIALLMFSGCRIKDVPTDLIETTEQEQTFEAVTQEAPITGGWTYASEFTDVQMPEDATQALTKAAAMVDGVIYKPVAYLGSQVVAGLNYAFICEVTTVTENPVSTLNVVKVYRDTEGNATITGSKAISLAEYNVDSEAKAQETPLLAGGWSFDEASGGKLPEDAKKAFSTVKQELDGSEYESLACLGSQVVAGTNYAVLCKDVSDGENISLSVIIIYAGVGGENQIVSIGAFAMPDFQ